MKKMYADEAQVRETEITEKKLKEKKKIKQKWSASELHKRLHYSFREQCSQI